MMRKISACQVIGAFIEECGFIYNRNGGPDFHIIALIRDESRSIIAKPTICTIHVEDNGVLGLRKRINSSPPEDDKTDLGSLVDPETLDRLEEYLLASLSKHEWAEYLTPDHNPTSGWIVIKNPRPGTERPFKND